MATCTAVALIHWRLDYANSLLYIQLYFAKRQQEIKDNNINDSAKEKIQ